jgi:predicted nucleic acid-binding protein
MTRVCVDAGLVIKLVTPEDDSHLVELLFSQWQQDGMEMIAPAFAPVEVDSVLRQKVRRGFLTQDVADKAFNLACQLPILTDVNPACRRRAWEIAKELDFPTVYDAVYLALAETRGCEFWTADQVLYDKVKGRYDFIRSLKS